MTLSTEQEKEEYTSTLERIVLNNERLDPSDVRSKYRVYFREVLAKVKDDGVSWLSDPNFRPRVVIASRKIGIWNNTVYGLDMSATNFAILRQSIGVFLGREEHESEVGIL